MHNGSWVTGSWVNASDPLPALIYSSLSDVTSAKVMATLQLTASVRVSACDEERVTVWMSVQ